MSEARDAEPPRPVVTFLPVHADTPAVVEILSSKPDGTSRPERAQRGPADWAHFAPQPQRPPSTAARLARRLAPVGRVLGHEWTVVSLAAVALAVLLNIQALTDLRHTLPEDAWDPSLLAYLVAWDGHALLHNPATLWHVNAFYPAPYGLAYSDALLGYAPFGFVGTGPEAAVLRYNIVFILAQALTLVGAYALVRQLGLGRTAATLAGVAVMLAPWRLGQAGHLQVISSGGMTLALAMLARGHGVRWRRGEGADGSEVIRRRPAWAAAGWLVATWQVSLGFGIGLVFIYVLLGVVLTTLGLWALRRRPLPPRRLLVVDGAGGALFAAVALLMAQPYVKVLQLYPYARRTGDWVALYSPPLRGFFTSPPESLVWGSLHASSRARLPLPAEMDLLPGFTLYALAAAGLLFSVWSWWVRLGLLAGVIVSMVLAMGTQGPQQGRLGYLLLLDHLPGFEGLRTPGRLIIWTTLLLALLAAGAVAALVQRARDVARRRGLPRPSLLAHAALLLPAILVLVEGIGPTPHAAVPAAPPSLAGVSAPYVVLPTDELRDMHVMLWSTDRFADMVNGGSSFVPTQLRQAREAVASFPDSSSVTYLRRLGVRTVVLLPSQVAGTPWADSATLPIDGLGITRDVHDDAVIFHLD